MFYGIESGTDGKLIDGFVIHGLCYCQAAMASNRITRRALMAAPLVALRAQEPGEWVNDIHSQLNRTHVRRVVRPTSIEDISRTVRDSERVSIAGGRHSMGGQQFGTETTLIDTRGMNRILSLDATRGVVDVEAGILWPELLNYLWQGTHGWGILQKQTGADRLSLGGALASNIHGRGLKLKPIIDQVESFTIVCADGQMKTCSRTENAELFSLAIGGYGLFGIVTTVRLRLGRRRKVERVVERHHIDEMPDLFESRIREGFLYGDFQYATDSKRDSFFRDGLFPSYRPVEDSTPLTEHPTRFNPEDWERLTYWSHRNRRLAFKVYTTRYLATSGQIYWSDSQLSAAYIDNYHVALDRRMHARYPATEMISELYVPRPRLPLFMSEARRLLRKALGGHVDKLEFLDERKLRLVERFSGVYRFFTGWDLSRALELLRPVFGLLQGVPTGQPLASTYWRKKSPPPAEMDPDRDGCGLLWCSPVAAATGQLAEELVALASGTLLSHGFEPAISLTMVTERSLACVISITYDRHAAGEDEKASACYRDLLHRLAEAGFYCYRLTSQSCSAMPASPGYDQMNRTLKDALDPNHILAPGRYQPAE